MARFRFDISLLLLVCHCRPKRSSIFSSYLTLKNIITLEIMVRVDRPKSLSWISLQAAPIVLKPPTGSPPPVDPGAKPL